METKEMKVIKHKTVEIEYTDKAKFHKAGQKATVHALQADKLIAKGFAKKAAPKKTE